MFQEIYIFFLSYTTLGIPSSLLLFWVTVLGRLWCGPVPLQLLGKWPEVGFCRRPKLAWPRAVRDVAPITTNLLTKQINPISGQQQLRWLAPRGGKGEINNKQKNKSTSLPGTISASGWPAPRNDNAGALFIKLSLLSLSPSLLGS